ncbi:YpzG family protein [Neobacillus sp. CF12]|nr:YpzG family protein [Neobacillus sp. CF12]MDM5326063.1 YpzG family protein [Neobacillus sp. CF12]
MDPHSLKFFKNSTRPKRASSQINGETRISQQTIILKSNAKAHRW